MFYTKEMHSACLLDLQDNHNEFWWETVNATTTPQSTIKI